MIEKIKESAVSVTPIAAIVLLLCLCIIPTESELLLAFLVGAAFIILGMGLFSLGAEQSMTPIGNKIGTALTKTQKMPLILAVSFVLGVAITVAEPDLQVLAKTVPHIDSFLLLITVGAGVGLFMAVCMLRIFTGAPLRLLLVGCYALIFFLAAFCDRDFLSVAFDSGGVTTGPMTVPFILALGIGVSNIRSDKKAEADSFGLVALCSIGPIIAVMFLGLFYPAQSADTQITAAQYADTAHIGSTYLRSLPHTLLETAVSLLPIAAVFVIFNAFSLKLTKRSFARICFGIFYTYAGLVLFLTGVNVGFSPLGTVLGSELMNSRAAAFAVPLASVEVRLTY